jgi:hypothetical protein
VTVDIPAHITRTEQRLHKLQQFQAEVSRFQQWLTSTRTLLEAQHAPSSATSIDQDDSIIVDPQVSASFTYIISTSIDQNDSIVVDPQVSASYTYIISTSIDQNDSIVVDPQVSASYTYIIYILLVPTRTTRT